MYSIILNWKQGFSVDLASMEAWIKTNAGSNYIGNSADSKLTLWFSQDPNIIPSTSVTSSVVVSPATIASVTLLGETIAAASPGAGGNISLTADGTSNLAALVAAWNAAHPSNQLSHSGSGDNAIPAAGQISLTGGADAITKLVTNQVPTGVPSQAQVIQNHWAIIDEQSPESVAYMINKTAAQYNAIATKAIAFGQSMLAQFAGQNLQLGITAAGKTKAVRVAMQDVTNCLSTGSLIEAIAEIKTVPSSAYDSTFITAARLLAACNQLETYCNLPLSKSLS